MYEAPFRLLDVNFHEATGVLTLSDIRMQSTCLCVYATGNNATQTSLPGRHADRVGIDIPPACRQLRVSQHLLLLRSDARRKRQCELHNRPLSSSGK